MTIKAERSSLAQENRRLRDKLLEQDATLRAIRTGEVDALVVETAGKDQVFTLKSADQTYRLMVEEMPTGAATLTNSGTVLYCNPSLAALLDVPLETVVGASLSSFLADPAISFEALLARARSEVRGGEVSFRRGEGSVTAHVSMTALPLAGAPLYFMIVTDLTEDKRREDERSQHERDRFARLAAEGAIQRAEEEIEHRKRVEDSLRTAGNERAELLERERVARTEAEDANRLKDEFLATLSHELRTPLAAILSWAYVLRRPGVDPAIAARAIETIERNARAQCLLVADILDVSRIITGKFQMNPGVVWLGAIIDLAADTVRPAAQAKGIHLKIVVDPLAGPVMGEPDRLQQVVWNLLSNAIRFTPAGGRVEVRVASQGSYVELSVTDDGSGIDPAFLPYMFDRFRQADASSTRRHAGLGLGLAIVRHLVELHGGTVEASNSAGRPGAMFIVRLPRAPENVIALPRPQKDAATSGAVSAAPSLQNVSILLVDDEDDAREAMGIALSLFGARVSTASSAQQALDLVALERPQVLISDIGMPGEDGHSLMRRVRLLPEGMGGAIPAIALTAYASPQDLLDVLSSGFQIRVTKPATPADVAKAVSTLVAVPPGEGVPGLAGAA